MIDAVPNWLNAKRRDTQVSDHHPSHKIHRHSSTADGLCGSTCDLCDRDNFQIFSLNFETEKSKNASINAARLAQTEPSTHSRHILSPRSLAMSAAAGVPKSDWSLPTRPGLQIEDVSVLRLPVTKCGAHMIHGALASALRPAFSSGSSVLRMGVVIAAITFKHDRMGKSRISKKTCSGSNRSQTHREKVGYTAVDPAVYRLLRKRYGLPLADRVFPVFQQTKARRSSCCMPLI